MGSIIAAVVGGILYRLRGGWFSVLARKYGWEWAGKQRTQTMRLIWALPTALLITLLLSAPSWWTFPVLSIAVFASVALWGHGAHMIFDTQYFIDKSTQKTELLTAFWLPQAFGGIPDATWPHWKATAYNLAGMSFIGLVRNTTAILPIFPFYEIPCLIYALTGLLHGPLYWLGWRIKDGETSEVVVGAFTWASIVWIFA
jgi:hypothetical protein